MSGADTILYAEVPDFYAAVARAADGSLDGRAVLVGGHPDRRGKVQSASREARASGVREGMPMREALSLCPDAAFVPTDMAAYREASGQLTVCIRRVVDGLEKDGLGAVYLDVGAYREAPEQIAAAIRDEVGKTMQLPIRAGIGPAKFLARLAARHAGEAGTRRVRAEEVRAFLSPLPISELPRAGPRTVESLARLGASRVGELLDLDERMLEAELGNHGLALLEYARGIDHQRVRQSRHQSSFARESRIESGGLDLAGVHAVLGRLAQALARALEREGLRARRVALKLRGAEGREATRSMTLGEPVGPAARIDETARVLLARAEVDRYEELRWISLTVAGLAEAGAADEQLELFSEG